MEHTLDMQITSVWLLAAQLAHNWIQLDTVQCDVVQRLLCSLLSAMMGKLMFANIYKCVGHSPFAQKSSFGSA